MTVIRYEEGYPLGKCELCGKDAELRPYGPNREWICFTCGMKDEEATERAFDENPYEPLAVKALKEGLN